MNRKFLILQTVVLAAGTVFAWYTVVNDFLRFYTYEGTLFKVNDCIVPNPVTTPCFYGAFGFAAALIWSIAIWRRQSSTGPTHQRRLWWLLLGGTLFAWSVNTYYLVKFYSQETGVPVTGCSGQLVDNPWTTPCSIGASLFLLSLIVGTVIVWRLRKGKIS